jgi:hypothetical protein
MFDDVIDSNHMVSRHAYFFTSCPPQFKLSTFFDIVAIKKQTIVVDIVKSSEEELVRVLVFLVEIS